MDLRGKECRPIDTINKIKNIVNELNLTVEEKILDSQVGVYSVQLTIFGDGFPIGSCNGKGMNIEYCLASAYGELIERLASFSMNSMDKYRKFPASSLSKYETLLYPNGKDIEINELFDRTDKLTKYFLNCFTNINNISKCLSVYNKVSNNTVKAVPYNNAISDAEEVVYMPEFSFQILFGTTGLCAGNTYEEAVCQGVSEIMERYCTQEIFRGKLTPPNIPDEYLKQFPDVWEIIKNIRSKPNKELYIKDCSLGLGFPVVASLLIDKEDHSYLINFGSSFIKNIAIERVITELFQGRDISNYSRIKYMPSLFSDINDNIERHYLDGLGEATIEFFHGEKSYEFNENIFIDAKDNKAIYTHIIEFLKEKDCSLYVKDNSFLGFNAYYVIIPELMPIIEIPDESYISTQYVDDILSQYHIDIENISYDDIVRYVELIDSSFNEFNYFPVLNKYVKYFNFQESLLGKYEDIRMLLALFHDILGRYEQAYLYVRDFINFNSTDLPYEIKEDLYIIRDFFNFKSRGFVSFSECAEYLRILYQDTRVNKFINITSTQKGLIYYFYGDNCGADKPLIEATTKYFDIIRKYMIENYKKRDEFQVK